MTRLTTTYTILQHHFTVCRNMTVSARTTVFIFLLQKRTRLLTHMKIEDMRSISVKHSTIDPFQNCDTFDYDLHDFTTPFYCLPEYDGFCQNDGVYFLLQKRTRLRTHMKIEDMRSICVKHSTIDPFQNHIFIK